jgi:hypothetical protein
METAAFGITAPVVSLTNPTIVPLAPPWALSIFWQANKPQSKNPQTRTLNSRGMGYLLVCYVIKQA